MLHIGDRAGGANPEFPRFSTREGNFQSGESNDEPLA